MSDSRGALVRRVLHEHRRWIWPLGVLLGVNVLAVVLGVLPMSRAVASAEQRAVEATADARVAASELADATAARDGRDTATRELASFRTEVLPKSVGDARRLLQLKVAQLARTHDITFARSIATPEGIRGSQLGRLQATIELVGRYRDVRQFLYELETSKDFVIVDSIVLSEGEDASSPLNLTLSLSTYFLAAPDVP
jgi:Tfp pilus assembly protein PilO